MWQKELRRSDEDIMTLIGINKFQDKNNNCSIIFFNDNDKETTLNLEPLVLHFFYFQLKLKIQS